MKKSFFVLSMLIFYFFVTPVLLAFGEEIDTGAYVPTILPDQNTYLWTILFEIDNPDVSFETSNCQLDAYDALYIDTYHSLNSQYYLKRNTTASNSTDTIEVEAKLRLDTYTGNNDRGGCAIGVENDAKGEVLCISPNKIHLYNAQSDYSMDTTDAFHTYRIVAGNNTVKIYVDGDLVISGALSALPWTARQIVAFGDGSAEASSRSSWAYVKYSVTND